MSFNPITKVETAKNQEINSNASNQQIVAYRGRNVAPLSYREEQQLTSMNLNFVDRLLLGMQNTMGVDLSKLPSSYLTMARKMMQMLDDKPPTSAMSIFGFKMELPIEAQIKVEEEHEAQQKKLICLLEDKFDQLKMERQQQLQLAGVSSPEELQKKEMIIDSYKIKAEERYLQDHTNLEMRKEIDKALITAHKGTLSLQDQKVIEDYWTLVSKGAEGAEKVKAVAVRSNQLFVKGMLDSLTSIPEKIEKMAKEGKKINQAEIMVNHFQDMLNETSQKLAAERRVCTNPEEAVYLDYLMLTGSYQMPTIMNSMLRNSLKPQLQTAKERLAIGVEYAQKENQDLIKWEEDWISSCEGRILKDQKKLGKLTAETECLREMYEKSIESAKESISRCSERISEYQAYEKKDFEKRACELFHLEHPREIKAGIPEETAFDLLYQQIMDVDTQGQLAQIQGGSLFTVSADMKLDLAKIENPEEHFFNKLKQLDTQKLALLKPTGIEEVV